jgi:hypothetical protein
MNGDETKSGLADLFAFDGRSAFSRVIVRATELERLLEFMLQAAMRFGISKDFQGKLFSGHGPLSTFSAKIDMAYALSLIEQDTWSKLHKVRDVRNTFAHADAHIDFDHPGFRSGKRMKSNPFAQSAAAFDALTLEIIEVLVPLVETGWERRTALLKALL